MNDSPTREMIYCSDRVSRRCIAKRQGARPHVKIRCSIAALYILAHVARTFITHCTGQGHGRRARAPGHQRDLQQDPGVKKSAACPGRLLCTEVQVYVGDREDNRDHDVPPQNRENVVPVSRSRYGILHNWNRYAGSRSPTPPAFLSPRSRRAFSRPIQNHSHPASAIPKSAYPIATAPRRVSPPCASATKPRTDVGHAEEVHVQPGAVQQRAHDRCAVRQHGARGAKSKSGAPPMSPMKIWNAVAVARFVCGLTFSAGHASSSAGRLSAALAGASAGRGAPFAEYTPMTAKNVPT
jgi:hypothetical protein